MVIDVVVIDVVVIDVVVIDVVVIDVVVIVCRVCAMFMIIHSFVISLLFNYCSVLVKGIQVDG